VGYATNGVHAWGACGQADAASTTASAIGRVMWDAMTRGITPMCVSGHKKAPVVSRRNLRSYCNRSSLVPHLRLHPTPYSLRQHNTGSLLCASTTEAGHRQAPPPYARDRGCIRPATQVAPATATSKVTDRDERWALASRRPQASVARRGREHVSWRPWPMPTGRTHRSLPPNDYPSSTVRPLSLLS